MPLLLLTHDPQQSPGITRAGDVLRARKMGGVPFERAWTEATSSAPPEDLNTLRWARDVLHDAYEDRGPGPLSSVLVES